MTYEEFKRKRAGMHGVVIKYGYECVIRRIDRRNGTILVTVITFKGCYDEWFEYFEIG